MIKLTTMQRKYLIRAALILLLIAGSFIVLWSSSRSEIKKSQNTETLEDCSNKKLNPSASGEMIWETLSSQFFSSFEIAQ
ncbi:MAG TPA: hypothetical protein VI548_06520 [Chitinophagaceae bacterium]|nr:hypothetical protein [Chitinophagaceae bacterium]